MACYLFLLFFKYILLTMQSLYVYDYVSLEKDIKKIKLWIGSDKKSRHYTQHEPSWTLKPKETTEFDGPGLRWDQNQRHKWPLV